MDVKTCGFLAHVPTRFRFGWDEEAPSSDSPGHLGAVPLPPAHPLTCFPSRHLSKNCPHAAFAAWGRSLSKKPRRVCCLSSK